MRPQDDFPGTPPTPPLRTPSPHGRYCSGLNDDADSEDEGESDSQAGHGIGSGNPGLLNTQDTPTHLEGLKSTLAVIREIKNASSSTKN